MRCSVHKRIVVILALHTTLGLALAEESTTDPSHDQITRLKPITATGFIERGAAHVHSQAWGDAIIDFGEAIRISSKDPEAYEWRGAAHLAKGDLTNAICDFTRAIQLRPTNATVYLNRANAFRLNHELDKAVADLDECLRLDPQDAEALATRADCLADKHFFGDAVDGYAKAIRVDPKNPHAYNGLAWLRATCPLASMRDPRQAVELGRKACQLTAWTQPPCIDTLAAAFAEAGAFDEAVKYQRQAMNMKGVSDNQRKQMHRRLSLYKQHRPYRQAHRPSKEHAAPQP